MKKPLLPRLLFALLFLVLLASQSADARIRFETTRAIQIDLENLEINSQTFFTYITTVIHRNPFGLQAYGQVPFNVCDMKLKGRKLFDYQTTKGRKVRFMSNPSCDQIVLRRLLEASYEYNRGGLSPYENRKCIRNIESIFSPLIEYYTIQYEEKSRPDCKRCDEKERERLGKIAGIQEKMAASCKGEQDKVIRFMNHLDETIEKAFQTKKK